MIFHHHSLYTAHIDQMKYAHRKKTGRTGFDACSDCPEPCFIPFDEEALKHAWAEFLEITKDFDERNGICCGPSLK